MELLAPAGVRRCLGKDVTRSLSPARQPRPYRFSLEPARPKSLRLDHPVHNGSANRQEDLVPRALRETSWTFHQFGRRRELDEDRPQIGPGSASLRKGPA